MQWDDDYNSGYQSNTQGIVSEDDGDTTVDTMNDLNRTRARAEPEPSEAGWWHCALQVLRNLLDEFDLAWPEICNTQSLS